MIRVGIIGIGMSRMEGESPLKPIDFAEEAIKRALEYAQLEPEEVDFVADAGYGELNSTELLRRCGLRPREHMSLRYLDGAFAAVWAVTKIMSGESKIALVVGYGKSSEVKYNMLSVRFARAPYLRGTGLNWINFSALQARAFMDRLGIGEEELGIVVIKNRSNAIENPDAHIREKIILDDILNSPYVVEPIRLLMMPARTDGAACIIFARGDIVKTRERRAWIEGFGVDINPTYPGWEDIVHLNSLRQAARRAYRMSAIKNPKREIDFAEITEQFPHIEIMSIEALELVAERRLVKPIRDGSFLKSGKLPINPSGGALCTNPPGAVGLIRIIELVKRLVGDVMDIRKSLRRGVANAHTFFHQYNVVWVVAGE